MRETEIWIHKTSVVVVEVFCKTELNYFYRPVGEKHKHLEMQLRKEQFEKEFVPEKLYKYKDK